MDFPFTDAELVRRAINFDCGIFQEIKEWWLPKRALYQLKRLVYNLPLSRPTLTLNPLKQRFVLAEAIKTSSVPVEKLMSFVDDGNVQPAWAQMLLPLGKPFLPSS